MIMAIDETEEVEVILHLNNGQVYKTHMGLSVAAQLDQPEGSVTLEVSATLLWNLIRPTNDGVRS